MLAFNVRWDTEELTGIQFVRIAPPSEPCLRDEVKKDKFIV
jgi:hypothetical protein